MKKLSLAMLVVLGVVLGSSWCRAGAIKADWTPLEFGIFSPVQLFDESSDICFLRLSTLYTRNQGAYGFDFGLVNDSSNCAGIQVTVANVVRKSQMGLGIGLINVTEKNLYGCQIGAFNKAGMREIMEDYDEAAGVQIGWVNLTKAIFNGLQIGIANLSTARFSGVQLGVVNSDRDHNNFDKVLNYKDKTLDSGDLCIQIGLLNFNEDGFLPIFPIINF